MKHTAISVVLPAYNEAENIEKQVHSIREYLQQRFSSFEIIVVNDGSTDTTGKVLKELQKDKLNNLCIVTHTTNRGYGTTLRTGFAKAKSPLIFYTDSDNQFDVYDMDKLLRYVNAYDIVAGIRNTRSDPSMRLVIAWVYNTLIQLLFRLPVQDIDCSFKLYKRFVFESITLRSQTGFIDAEIFIKAIKRGFRVKQVPVRHFPRRRGTTIYELGSRKTPFIFVKPSVVTNIFAEIYKLWGELR